MDYESDVGAAPSAHPCFTLQRGSVPLLVSFPHSGVQLLEGLRDRLTPEALALPDTDWHVEKLYSFARSLQVSWLEAHLSRYVIDLNRDPGGASLYPGKSVTELCPLTTFACEPVHRAGAEPTEAEVAARVREMFVPYHAALGEELERIRAQHGYAILLEAHSIRSHVPRFFDGRLPDLNLGSAQGLTTSAEVERAAAAVLETSGLSWVVNGRFQGGYITRHFGRPSEGIHALQLEIAMDCYMEEQPPYAFEIERASHLTRVLRRFVEALLTVRP